MQLTGVKAEGRVGDESDFVIFDVSDLLYIVLEKPSKSAPKQPLFVTKHGKYWTIGSLEGYGAVLKEFGVTRLDSVNLVNINNVVRVKDTGLTALVFFENGMSTTVSRSNLYKIEHLPRSP